MINIKIVFLLFLALMSQAHAKKTPVELVEKESVVLFSEGAKKDIFINGKPLSILKKMELPEGAYTLETQAAELKLKWGQKLKLKLFEKTKIQLEIKKDTAPLLVHKTGKIQVILQGISMGYQVEKLFQFALQSGEAVIEVHDKNQSVKFSSLQGEQKVQILEDDRVQVLKEGTSLELTPEWSDGEMVYDFLLNNKKIPRMHAVQGGIQGELKSTESQWKFEINKKASRSSLKKAVKKEDLTAEQLEKKIQQVKFSKTICRHPNGAYGECLWEKEKGSCVRYTCNLNGEWAQKTEFNLTSECPRKKQVKSCEWLR